jgi:hypothetical protein
MRLHSICAVKQKCSSIPYIKFMGFESNCYDIFLSFWGLFAWSVKQLVENILDYGNNRLSMLGMMGIVMHLNGWGSSENQNILIGIVFLMGLRILFFVFCKYIFSNPETTKKSKLKCIFLAAEKKYKEIKKNEFKNFF